MANYLPLDAFFPSFFALLRPPGSGSAFGIRIRIQAATEGGSNTDPEPKHCHNDTITGTLYFDDYL
jgi:hypothetical protein